MKEQNFFHVNLKKIFFLNYILVYMKIKKVFLCLIFIFKYNFNFDNFIFNYILRNKNIYN